ncbi:MAG: hypothetical protein Q9201_002162 [Fulgogasparrea decipioides]
MSSHQWNPEGSSSSTELTWSERLERLKVPTVQELLGLQRLLDNECLSRFRNPNDEPGVPTGVLVQITLCVSGRLVDWSGPLSGRLREVQLRALVGALALLHHNGLTALASEPYDELRMNIANRFNDIVDGRRNSGLSLEDRMRKANALYLIRLVAQYFSLIRRAQPLSDALSIPIIGLVLAGAGIASGQYNNLQAVFRYADDVIGLLPGRTDRYLNLPAIQELTRNAISVLATADTGNHDVEELENVEMATDVVNLVQELLRIHIRAIPSRRSDAWNWPLARFRRGPPLMNKWYFFYGLLDCAAQLARHLLPEQMPADLLGGLERLMNEADFEEFRWKVVEILQAYNPSSIAIYDWLESLHRDSKIEEPRTVLQAVRNILGDYTSSASGDQTAPRRTHVSASPTALRQQTTYSSLMNAQLSYAADEIEPCRTEESNSTMTADKQSSCSSLAGIHWSYASEKSEAISKEYMESDLRYWQQDGDVQVSQLLPARVFFHKGYTHAGLSLDCNLVFFYHSTKICVYRANTGGPSELLLERKFEKNAGISDVSLSRSILAVSTRQRVELYRIRSYRPGLQPMKVLPHGDWDPSGVAIYEGQSQVLVAIGHRRETQNSRKGRIVLHRMDSSCEKATQMNAVLEYMLPMQDMPKVLSFAPEGNYLTCITNVMNTILVWIIECGAPSNAMPSTITKYTHRPETDSDGLTSAVSFQRRSRAYMLCTTSAATERFRSHGEWPFSSPIPQGETQAPPSATHHFIALKDYRQLVAGAVSSVANIFAVLEKSGRILILHLTGHEDGGVTSLSTRDGKPESLQVSLNQVQSLRTSTQRMRFDPSGEKLYAVDPEGKLVVVTFTPGE